MDYQKLSPELLLTMQDYEQKGREGLIEHMGTLGVVAPVESPKPPRIIVILHCDADANFDHLAEHGVRVNQAQGEIRTAFLPMDSLALLAAEPGIRRIEPSRQLNSLMDVAAPRIRVPDFRQANGLDGRGVVIGVIDSGIDAAHAAFSGRVVRIWDQTLDGPGVPEGSYGLEVTPPNLSASRDTNGHGTHVAGIAAGNDALFGGVAPAADLVVVKTDLQNAHIIDAVGYVFRVASDLGKPAVINLSLGGHADPHDGSDPLSLVIDAQSGPGRVVCCAAGNEGNDDIHAQTTVGQGQEQTIRFHLPPSQGTDAIGIAALNGWYSGSDRLEIAIQSPSGFQTPFQGVIAAGNPSQSFTLPDAQVSLVTPGPAAPGEDHNFFVIVQSATSSVPDGLWAIKLRGVQVQSGRVDIWSLDDNRRLTVSFVDAVSDAMKIGSPGAANSAVTVASFTSKVAWTDIDGALQQVSSTVEDVSAFSSEGPLRNGVQKPDVAAPGEWIAAALSADSLRPNHLKVSPHHVVLRGTSMATPVVTGLIALMLQQDPTLTGGAIKNRLRASSAIPQQPAGSFDPKWGYGLVDALGLGARVPVPAIAQRTNGAGSHVHGAETLPAAPAELIVIARPEAALRITGDGVASLTGLDTSGLTSLLASEGVVLQPLFGMNEGRLRFETASLAAESAADVPDLARFYRVEVPEERMEEIAARLRSQETIEAAYVKPPASPAVLMTERIGDLNDMQALVDAAPLATPNFMARQGYLNAAPTGVDAFLAWTVPGGRGADVNVIDIEGAWNFMHEDLLQNQGGVVAGVPTGDVDWRNHGTAVVGEIGGDRNSFGVVGISPDAHVRASSIFGGNGSAAAIFKAANVLNAGDILLIELHRPGPEATGSGQQGFIAIEWWPDDLAAIQFAVAKGVIVVEAAGNGGVDFDSAVYNQRPADFPTGWLNPLNPANPSSGAVVVGAGAPPPGTHGRDHGPDRSRLGFSNYGARVDCQGWGREVTTTGYGDLQGGNDEDLWYTDRFSGTSSASPIVVGVLASIQGVAKAHCLAPLSPARARHLLRTTGSQQMDAPGRPATQRIGNRPDLRQLIQEVLA